MTERNPGSSSPGLPSPEQVIELLSGPFERSGYEIEGVTIDARTQPPRLRVVADGDSPLDLDTLAELSRTASELLDAVDGAAGTYLLEVTSLGVDGPPTTEKHFRRARGRRVEIVLADGTAQTGRLGEVSDGSADFVVRDRSGWMVRRIHLADVRSAVVQVEFSPPSTRELELAGLTRPGESGTAETTAGTPETTAGTPETTERGVNRE